MAALANGVLDVLDAALNPPTNDGENATFLARVEAAAAAFVDSEVPARNARLVEAAVRALWALVPPPAQEEKGEERPFTVVTLSLSSTVMAVFRGLLREGQERRRALRVVRVCVVWGWGHVGGHGGLRYHSVKCHTYLKSITPLTTLSIFFKLDTRSSASPALCARARGQRRPWPRWVMRT